VIEKGSHTVDRSYPAGRQPSAIAVDSRRHTIYVSNYDDNSVTVFASETGTRSTITGVGVRPLSIAVDAVTDTVYVASENDTVTVIDGRTDRITATLAVGHVPESIVVDPGTHTAYVTDNQANAVSAISPG
jgi:YVTN family beta-propeller protein